MRISITDHGAVGNGTTLNTAAIQAAIEQVSAAGGGVVVVPPGVFLTGSVELRSRITLELQPGAVLRGSPNIADYRTMTWGQHIDRTPWHLVAAHGCQDVRICGGGTIDGNGRAFWEPTVGDDPLTCLPAREPDRARAEVTWIKANYEHRPSPMIEITGCRDVRIEDVHITNSAGWNLHLHNCNFVWVRGVKLTAHLFGPNNDGFDITGCHDVMVSDCYLSCCDDAICLKTTPDSQTCERITVTNCVMRTLCVGLKLGCSESYKDIRQVTFSNCVVRGSHRAFGLYCHRGATFADIAVSNIVCDTRTPLMLPRPIHIEAINRDAATPPSVIRNVSISNLIAQTNGRILIAAAPGNVVENITLRDVQLDYVTLDDPALKSEAMGHGQFARFSPWARAERAALVAENIRNLIVEGFVVHWPAAPSPDEWRFPLKAANGCEALFTPPDWGEGQTAPWAAISARNIQGGHLRATGLTSFGGEPHVVKTENSDWRLTT
jgi:polygalacturonase